jgi:hypothetical protein
MNIEQGKNTHPFRIAQYPILENFYVKRAKPDLTTRGARLAYARRLLGAALNQELGRGPAAALIGTTGTTWGRWETNDDRFRDATLQEIVKLFHDAGLEWVTPAWLDHGYGEAPVIVTSQVEGLTTGKRGPVLPESSRQKKKA